MGQGSSTTTNTKQLPSKSDSADEHILSNLCGNQGYVVDEGCTSYKISLRQKRDENSFISEAREQPKLTYTEDSANSLTRETENERTALELRSPPAVTSSTSSSIGPEPSPNNRSQCFRLKMKEGNDDRATPNLTYVLESSSSESSSSYGRVVGGGNRGDIFRTNEISGISQPRIERTMDGSVQNSTQRRGTTQYVYYGDQSYDDVECLVKVNCDKKKKMFEQQQQQMYVENVTNRKVVPSVQQQSNINVNPAAGCCSGWDSLGMLAGFLCAGPNQCFQGSLVNKESTASLPILPEEDS